MDAKKRYVTANSLARSIMNAHHFKRDDYFNEYYEPEEYETQLGKLWALLGFETADLQDKPRDYTWVNQERYWRWKEVKDRYCFVLAYRALEKPLETIERWIGLCK